MNILRYILIIVVLIAFQVEFVLFERKFNTSVGVTENQFNSKEDVSLLFKEHEVIKMIKRDKSLFRIVPYRPIDKSYDIGFGHISLDDMRRSTLSVQIIPLLWGQVFRIPSIGHEDYLFHSFLSPQDATSLIDLAYDTILKRKDVSVLDMINAKYVLSTEKINHPKLELLEESKDVFSDDSLSFSSRFFEVGPVYVYINRSVWPRVFLASNIIFLEPENTLKYLETNLLGKNTAIVHDNNLMKLNNSSLEDRLDIEQYNDSSIKIKYRAKEPTLLVVSDHFSKGWHCYINGNKIKTYRVNYCFRGIPLSTGEGIVFMKYLPNSFIIGLIMMGMGILFLILLTIFIQKNHYVKKMLIVPVDERHNV